MSRRDKAEAEGGAGRTEGPPKKTVQTTSHIVVPPFCTPADLADFNYDEQLSTPGHFPFTRGVQASMYRGHLWTMRQYAGMGDAEESNRRFRFLLAHGTTGLSVAFDLPTQIGYDSDHPYALGEVGRVGVAIDSVEDMERLFEAIDLEKVSTSMTINSTASVLLALYCKPPPLSMQRLPAEATAP
jgi:methylmalonyl-CoA mutase N-terminal domain/subunit